MLSGKTYFIESIRYKNAFLEDTQLFFLKILVQQKAF